MGVGVVCFDFNGAAVRRPVFPKRPGGALRFVAPRFNVGFTVILIDILAR
jgi:hypothetical protein